MSKLAKALTAAAGNAGESLYVEDVFSTYLYTGTGSTRYIDNGIALSDEGGLVWLKNRDAVDSHALINTIDGPTKRLSSNSTDAAQDLSAYFSFPSAGTTGFNLLQHGVNTSGQAWSSWSFRKAEKFFDVVTYTGNSTAGRTVSHNLGSTPAVIIVKKTSSSSSSNWYVYHSSLGSSAHILLNTTAAADTASSGWNNTNPTATEFTLGNNVNVNANGESFVAYLFASDAGGFGDDGDESIIKCGSYVEAGSGLTNTVELGFEPQWVLLKETTNGTVNWTIQDTMRGMASDGRYIRLEPNTSNAEQNSTWSDGVIPTATGFIADNQFSGTPGLNVIYIAIRRPMKTPESGTEVFAVDTQTGASGLPAFNSGFPVDFVLRDDVTSTNDWLALSRLTGTNALVPNTTAAETAGSSWYEYDYMDGWGSTTVTNTNFYSWMFKRATGFFDVVAYSGTGSAHAEDHNLGVVPEMMVVKSRSDAFGWHVYANALGNTKAIRLDQNGSSITSSTFWNNTSPTSANFTVGTFSNINSNGSTFIAYLFATLAGVSKVGSYTGTGSNVDVDCGFSAGARFILIKRTDSTGDWYVWDSERGIVAGNDPYLLLNSTAAEVTNTDYIDPLSSGFTVTSSAPAALNASGGTYIFMAIS